MVEIGRALLRKLLVSGYDDLRRRLTRRLGSADAATEVLHEAWLRLDRGPDIVALERPQSYLYRMALNVAVDRQRAENRWVGKAELEALMVADTDVLDPEHIAAMRSEMAALERVVAQLPARCRAVFTAALVDELSYREIAERLGISLRTVEREMNHALAHCGKHFEGARLKRRARASADVLYMGGGGSRAADHDHDE
ncbi:RNA polymerase sigma factor [Bradyrhizobium sp. 2TAF24]|uniref:RNA polymerase sigma factor n=1 Tax=Bradyrhizobium sp. 2TAF24 TaxID=3233011 RepID=UPI003F921C6E